MAGGERRMNEETTTMNLQPHRPAARRLGRPSLLAVFAAVVLCAAALCGTAQARVPVYAFEATTSSTQAGGHPDLVTRVEVGTFATEGVEECFCNAIRDITVKTPPGIVGVPSNITQCTASELAANKCPTDSQVGVVAVRLFAPLAVGGAYFVQPLYNMEARPGQLALLATLAPLLQTPIYTVVSARTESDYGLEFKTFGIPRLVPPNEITQFTWGVPADPSHDDLRWATDAFSKSASCYEGDPLPALRNDEFPDELCSYGQPGDNPAISPPTPFLLNPTSCEGPLTAVLDTSGYENGTEHREAAYPETTGCDALAFNPSLSAEPTTNQADSPSGLNIDLKVPQFLSPYAESPSEIHGATVTLPPGLTIDPNVADGKLSCSDEEAAFGTRSQALCPEYSKIGSLTLESSSLPAPLPGAIYLGKPLPGNRYRVFLVADGFSLHIKLAGSVTPDPQTGQLVISFKDLPQTPFQEFNMHLFGAERGLLATPTHCGKYPVVSEFEPWDGDLPNQTSTQFFTIESGPGGTPCPPDIRPFHPGIEAGVTDNTSGSHTTFAFNLTRSDGDQNLNSITIATPPGFIGSLAGVRYCPEATLAADAAATVSTAAPQCPAASKIGDAVASAGSGTKPVPLPGSVYMAGPYKGAPLSLAVVTPAVVGPYDLGDVVIRTALQVNPVDAHITAISDALPQMIGGIPVRLRQVIVVLNRPGFALNPTNCNPFAITSQISGDQGAVANGANHFQVADCGALPFEPKLALKLSGGTKRTGHPALLATLTGRGGEANVGRTVVTMPHALFLDNAHINAPCTRAQYAVRACPASSELGWARVETPLLDNPLEGPVYLRSSSHKLPDIVADLKGQVEIELDGRVDSVHQRLRASFESAPDVPVSKFTLRMVGGKKGLLINSENLCLKKQRATVRMVGQNGRRRLNRPTMQIACGKRKHAKRHGRAAR
jgi:hypothetical protein